MQIYKKNTTVILQTKVRVSNLERENQTVKNQIKTLTSKHDFLRQSVRQLEINIESMKQQTAEELEAFKERDMLNRIKYEDIESKYTDLQIKASQLQQQTAKKRLGKENTSKNHHLRKARKEFNMTANQIKDHIQRVKDQTKCINEKAIEKRKYLESLLIKLNNEKEKQKEPNYMASSSRRNKSSRKGF